MNRASTLRTTPDRRLGCGPDGSAKARGYVPENTRRNTARHGETVISRSLPWDTRNRCWETRTNTHAIERSRPEMTAAAMIQTNARNRR